MFMIMLRIGMNVRGGSGFVKKSAIDVIRCADEGHNELLCLDELAHVEVPAIDVLGALVACSGFCQILLGR